MSFQVTCPCGNVLPVPESMAGYAVTCSCGRLVPVPPLTESQPQVFYPRLVEESRRPQLWSEPADSDAYPSPTGEEPRLNRVAEFHRALLRLTPRVYITWALIGLNVLVFVLMALSGVSVTKPKLEDLERWGSNFGPYTIGGEWWRLFTCTFVHIGLLHILFNMVVLGMSGPLVERMLGNTGFLLTYLVAGLCGSLASLIWNPMLVSAGASGAIFGVYGALLGLLLRQRGSIPTEALTQLRNSGLGFLGYNVLFDLTQTNIDLAAHIGGLAGGFLCGLVVSQPFTAAAKTGRLLRNVLVTGLGLVLVVGGIVVVQAKYAGLGNAYAALENSTAVENKVLPVFNAAVKELQAGKLNNAGLADVLEREVLPEWRIARGRLLELKEAPATLQRYVTALREYMRLREEAWDSLAQGLREGNEQKMQAATEKQKQADAEAKRIGELGRK